jgi:hypothetical protein
MKRHLFSRHKDLIALGHELALRGCPVGATRAAARRSSRDRGERSDDWLGAHAGRLSQLKRGCGVRRSRLKAKHGMRVWTGWGILTYNLDTLAIRTS